MSFTTQINNELLDLKVNNQLRTEVKIDLEKLYNLVKNNQSTIKLINNLEIGIDKIMIHLLENFIKLTVKEQKSFLSSLKVDFYYYIFDNFKGINHDQETEKVDEEVYLALNYFRELQKKRDLMIDEFIKEYKYEKGKIVRVF